VAKHCGIETCQDGMINPASSVPSPGTAGTPRKEGRRGSACTRMWMERGGRVMRARATYGHHSPKIVRVPSHNPAETIRGRGREDGECGRSTIRGRGRDAGRDGAHQRTSPSEVYPPGEGPPHGEGRPDGAYPSPAGTHPPPCLGAGDARENFAGLSYVRAGK
jgi:hypothetical protein